jgi:hypothetical protein
MVVLYNNNDAANNNVVYEWLLDGVYLSKHMFI